ncbi:hypothetical protein MTR_0030s0390 [Medicago truncatula]|uniref:Uncharacterized protein n=1 Tax=Medicago truncatula TaxID=3880 RepID=A0A072TIK8_MEDTR|nr:hypothetical protein MTR_0030s0390 [Medicago truncatula]
MYPDGSFKDPFFYANWIFQKLSPELSASSRTELLVLVVAGDVPPRRLCASAAVRSHFPAPCRTVADCVLLLGTW